MINVIFVFIFLIGLIYSILTNRVDIVVNTLLTTPKEAFFVFLDIYALLVFWSGILEICKDSGLLKKITFFISRLIHPLFKKLDKDSDALQYISINFAANMLSMGSAATPFGLKAMSELNKINNYSEVASNEMVTFVLINTSGLCLIPTTLISLRTQSGSSNAVMIIPYIIIVSCLITFLSIIFDIGARRYGKN